MICLTFTFMCAVIGVWFSYSMPAYCHGVEWNNAVNSHHHRFPHHLDEKEAMLTGKSRHLLGEYPRTGVMAPTEGREDQLKTKAARAGAKVAMTTGKIRKGG